MAAVLAVFILLTTVCTTGCLGGPGGTHRDDPKESNESTDEGGEAGGFVPQSSWCTFDNAEEVVEGVKLDKSTSPDGYIGLSIENESKIKVLLIKDEAEYIYNVPTDGTVFYVNLPCGDGVYRLRVMQNTVGSKYFELYSEELDIKQNNEFTAFLRPTIMVNYVEDYLCVTAAAEMADEASDDFDFMKKVYDYIKNHVVYDHELAETVEAGYLPDPDVTYRSGKGICLDYAALAAAMMRSQGIPVKVIAGYVGEDALYHAWNSVYIKGKGWISIELKINPLNWNRFDLTYAAENTSESIYVDSTIY